MGEDKTKLSLHFLGAAKTVTGSKTLLTYNGYKILIDCGLFQGPKTTRLKNWDEFELAKDIDAVILTHAHIDHSGYLPKIVKEGFSGPIYCSYGTNDLCHIMLPDSAHLQEEDAKYANKSRHSKHTPALPLYEIKDAKKALEQFKPLAMNEWIELVDGLSIRLLRAGHILGSSLVQFSVEREQRSEIITFSGDLGNGRQNVIKGPVQLLETDYLIMEGTYGDRIQSKKDPLDVLEECIKKVHDNNAVLVIPSFAVGRTQEILYLIRRLEVDSRIPEIPVFLDSPMAIEATDVYFKHKEELMLQMDDKGFIEPLCTHSFEVTKSTDDSMLLCMRDGPMVVISAAGMLSGGRILHHLKKRLPFPENIVIFVGWQAEETKGRLLQHGLPKIRIHHHDVDVEAQIYTIDSLSAHADSQDIIEWIEQIDNKPKMVFLNHGEEAPLNTLKYRIQHELGLNVTIPEEKQIISL